MVLFFSFLMSGFLMTVFLIYIGDAHWGMPESFHENFENEVY